ncbi:AbrB/MazE/SpoVT family DNA-binding domain-containing protein [Halobaculum magnesiiphilum]|uniref:AbrB/MazE/SpoVT family DNA-binding domain-containing protein n=1 Tax=Halobaculum magnesiiphilum TaxID=1017351 RepID=A0A8T8W9X7_9EURY|nr:AbrB/MazE/SpoVT family DNA-binding domain-containing protein [Halobaculum magnesiiphilum]QZP36637.1 AbrB/MazE/SpoVT family DNA-binding domain-containing protein [Halobaculum magnesiiphilum]
MRVDAADGRIYLPKSLREEFGDRFELVEREDRLLLIPVADDPLAALREEFRDVEGSADELAAAAEEEAIEEARR